MNYKILPAPKSIKYQDDMFKFSGPLSFYSNCSNIFIPEAIRKLLSDSKIKNLSTLNNVYSFIIANSSEKVTQLVKNLPEDYIFSNNEEYHLRITRESMVLLASEPRGLLNALSTLNAIILQSQNGAISCLEIKDYPDLKMRGAMICWHQVHDFMPYFGPDYKTVCNIFLDTFFESKLNYILLEYECLFPWDKHASLSCKDSFTSSQVRQLSLEAEKRGIEIIPLVQTLGHVYHILSQDKYKHLSEDAEYPQQLCPLNEEAKKLAINLIDETIALHPQSKYIHLGGDECRQLGACPKCKKYAERNGKYTLYAQYYKELTDYVIRKGFIPVLWHDIAVKEPSVLSEFSDQVVFHFWNYGDKNHGEISPVLNKLTGNIPAGRLIGGSANRCEKFHGCIFPPIRISVNNVKEVNKKFHANSGLGTIMTDWPDSGIPFLCSLSSFVIQADSSWNVIDFDFTDFKHQYANFRFGFESQEFLDKLMSLYGEIPFAPGFQNQLFSPLNRYKFEPFIFDEFLSELTDKYAVTSFIYQLTNRILQCKDLIKYFKECLIHAQRNSFEIELYILCAELTDLFCRLTASVITIKATPEKLELGWRMEEAAKELQGVLKDWDELKSKTFTFYSKYTNERHLLNWLNMFFKPEIKAGAKKLILGQKKYKSPRSMSIKKLLVTTH